MTDWRWWVVRVPSMLVAPIAIGIGHADPLWNIPLALLNALGCAGIESYARYRAISIAEGEYRRD